VEHSLQLVEMKWNTVQTASLDLATVLACVSRPFGILSPAHFHAS